MDPNTGKIYDEHEMTDLPDHIRDTLIMGSKEELEQLSEAIKKKNTEELVQAEAEELDDILEALQNVKEMPNTPSERFYPVNRAARRNADKRNRALKKRKPNGA